MHVKVCPKCGAENKETSAACSNCYAPLEGVSPTQSTKASQPVQSKPAPRQTPRPTPSPAPTQQMPGPGQTQMGPVGPPPMTQRLPDGAYMRPPKRSSPVWIIVVLLVVVLGSVGTLAYFAATRSGLFKPEPMPTEAPDQVVVAFLAAKKTHAITKVKPFLTQASLDLLGKLLNTEQGRSAGFDRPEVARMFLWEVSPTPDELSAHTVKAQVVPNDPLVEENDGRAAVVYVELVLNEPSMPQSSQSPEAPSPPAVGPQAGATPNASDEGPLEIFKREYIYVLYPEEGKWKVDLQMSTKKTSERFLGKLLNQ
jgi:hypothetical protein